MNKKTLLVTLLILFTQICIAQDNTSSQLLWKISQDNRHTSYLFGTMHVKDSRAFNFCDSVYLAIEACNSFALEIHPDSLVMEAIKTFVDVRNTENEDLLEESFSEEEVERYKKKFEKLNGRSLEDEDKSNPIAILNGLKTNNQFGEEETVVDVHLLRIARLLAKKIKGLESFENQKYLLGYSDKDMFKKNILEMLDTTMSPKMKATFFDQLVNSYQNKDLTEIELMIGPNNLNDSINILRNTDMANSIERISKSESIFAAVGVAHLLGENSVISMLRDKGYTVTSVQANYTDIKDRFTYDVNKIKWITNENEELGCSVQTPLELQNLVDLLPNFKMCTDICENMAMGYLIFDLRNNKKTLSRKEAFNLSIKNFKLKTKNHKIRRKKINGKKVDIFEGIGKNDIKTTLNFYWKNNIAYCFYTTGNRYQDNTAASQKFFQSVQLGDALPLPEYTGLYKDLAGAYAVEFPSKPNSIIQEVEDPESISAESYKVFINHTMDIDKGTAYYLFYNDYPTGYYLEDSEYFFDIMDEEIASMSEIISQKDTRVDGAEAKLYSIIMNKTFYAEMMVFSRGNRVFKIMSQNLSPNINMIGEDGKKFLNSFRFLEYQDPETNYYYSEIIDQNLIQFSTTFERVDTTEVMYSYFGDSYQYATLNRASGGLFVYYENDFGEYFQTEHIDSFLNDYKSELITWKDSILLDTILHEDGNRILHLELSQNKFGQIQKFQAWMDGNQLKTLSMYSSIDEANTSSEQLFFNHFDKGNHTEIDYSISKKEKIFDNLHSTDTLVFDNALGSFSYYNYKTDDITFLHNQLYSNFRNDSITEIVHLKILNTLESIKDKNSISALCEIYKSPTVPESTKENILSSLVYYDKTDYIERYIDLIKNYPIKDLNLNWSHLKPFRDSSELIKENIDFLLDHIKTSTNDAPIIQVIVNHLNEEDENYFNLVDQHFDKITVNAFSALDTLAKKKKENEHEYFWNYGNQFHMLALLQKVNRSDFAKEYTNRFFNIDTSQYARTTIIATQIINKLDYDEKVAKKFLDSLDTQKEIVDAFIDSDQKHKIPTSLNGKAEYAKLTAHQYLYADDYDYYDTLSPIGIIKQEKNREYHTFIVSYSYEDEIYNHLLLIGPFPSDSENFDRKELIVRDEYRIDSSKWEEIALKLLKESTDE